MVSYFSFVPLERSATVFIILFGISVVCVKRTVPSDFGTITNSWIGNAVFAYQCPKQHISFQHPWLAVRNRSTWLLHPNLEGTQVTPDFQALSVIICACANFVRHNSSTNSALVLGRLFCFIFFGFAQVSLTLVKLKDGEQRRLQSASAALCQTPRWPLWLL